MTVERDVSPAKREVDPATKQELRATFVLNRRWPDAKVGDKATWGGSKHEYRLCWDDVWRRVKKGRVL